jgi:hypothetical protein
MSEERTVSECDRTIIDDSGIRWDHLSVQDARDNSRRGLFVSGLVRGDEGALILRLPHPVTSGETCYIVRPQDARELRNALNARVTDAAGREVVGIQSAGGCQEVFYADGTSEVYHADEGEEDDEAVPFDDEDGDAMKPALVTEEAPAEEGG